MKSRLAKVVGLLALAGCAGARTQPDVEPEVVPSNAAAMPLVIAPNRTEIVVYENPGGEDGLPALVPVVVSSGVAAPSVAIRIACGANYDHMLEGFGYSGVNLDTVAHYSSLESLASELRGRTPDKHEVPMRTLGCDRDDNVVRSQLVGIYRVVDADPAKGQASYYARLRDDPGAIYSLGCWNLVKALSWDNGTTPPTTTTPPDAGAPTCGWGCGWEDSATIPINQANLTTWDQAGVVRRELNCYNDTGRAMPPVKTALPSRPRPAPAPGAATLARVRYPFDGINAPMSLYLISNGKGYALDCGSNQREIKQAFGFDPDRDVDELAVSDPLFLASHPGEQPNLRCNDATTKAFQTVDESPPSTYFQFAGATRLFQFTSDLTRDVFLADATEVRKVPWASIPHLIPDERTPNAPTEVLPLGYATSNECTSRSANCGAGTGCVDDPTGFHCEACGAGYVGDGLTCRDIDECASRKATCTNKTRCVNEVGRYRCDACPAGQTSDGYTCLPGNVFTFFDTLDADRRALGFSAGQDGNAWLTTAGHFTAARMASLFCRSKGFPAGRVTGFAAGEKIGVRCTPTDAVRFDTTKAQRDAIDKTVGDVTKANWFTLHWFAYTFCPTKGYPAGFFTGETSGTNAVVYCLPKTRATWFDTVRADRKATGFPFDTSVDPGWSTATKMATKYCEKKGFSGGFCTGGVRDQASPSETFWGLQCYK